jgi:hypothetical protein
MSSFQSSTAGHDSKDVAAVAASLESTSLSSPNDANIATNTATVDESPIQCHSFRFVCGDCAVRGHFIKLDKSVFLVRKL